MPSDRRSVVLSRRIHRIRFGFHCRSVELSRSLCRLAIGVNHDSYSQESDFGVCPSVNLLNSVSPRILSVFSFICKAIFCKFKYESSNNNGPFYHVLGAVQDNFLLVVARPYLYQIDLGSNTATSLLAMSRPGLVAVAYDSVEMAIYWTDVDQGVIGKDRLSAIGQRSTIIFQNPMGNYSCKRFAEYVNQAYIFS